MTRNQVVGCWTAALAAVFAAQAADTSWRPAGEGNWTEPTNWTAGVPSTVNRAVINNGGTAVLSEAVESASMLLGNTAAQSGNVRLTQASAVLSNNATIVSVGVYGTGQVEHVDGTFIAGNRYGGGGLYLGNAGGVGRYVLSNGLLEVYGTINLGSASGRGYFVQHGGTFLFLEKFGTNEVPVVNTGRIFMNGGTYDLYGGSLVVTGQAFCVGSSAGDFRMTVDGTNALILFDKGASTPPFFVGNDGYGELRMKRGTITAPGGVTVGSTLTGLVVQTGGLIDASPKVLTMGVYAYPREPMCSRAEPCG